MIGLLLASMLARADDVATYDRLFGPADAAPVELDAGPELPSPWRLVGPVALGAVGLAGAWWVRRRAPTVGGARPLAIVWRQPLGDRGALVLVDVVDADGETRRLLVGTGGGPPSLVADLGTALPAEAPMAAALPEMAPPARVPAAAASRNAALEVLAERRGAPRKDGGPPLEVHPAATDAGRAPRDEPARGGFAREAARRGLPC